MNLPTATPADAWRARKDDLANWAYKLCNRVDAWGQYIEPARRRGGPDGQKAWTAPKKENRGKVELKPVHLAMHFAGTSQNNLIGLHTTSKINTSRFGAIEVDRHDDSIDAKTTIAAARFWYDKAMSLGMNPLLFDSNGDGGAHLLMIWPEPISTPRVFRFLKWLCSDFQDHGLSKVETFPKQPTIRAGGYGNLLRLPGRHHTREHWTRVWDGLEWREGKHAVELILSSKTSDPSLIPIDAAAPKPKPPRPAEPSVDAADRVKRCEAYIEWIPQAISGQHGHDRTYNVCCEIWRFGLSEQEGCDVIERWNASRTGGEQWSKEELAHKLSDSLAEVRGAGEFGKRLREERTRRNDPIMSALQRQSAGVRKSETVSDSAVQSPAEGNDDEPEQPVKSTSEAPAADPPEDSAQRENDKNVTVTDSTAAVDDGFEILDKRDPLPTARKFIDDHYRYGTRPTLLYAGEANYAWDGTAYREVEPAGIRSQLYPWLERHRRTFVDRKGNEHVVPFQPCKGDIELTVDALRGLAYTAERAPAWLGIDGPDPAHLLVAPNGVFHLTAAGCRKFSDRTPLLFTVNALDYPVDLNAADPVEWLRFVERTWPDDPESAELLQEFFGLALTAETRYQKMLGLIGPPRSGKGTICRVLSHTIGMENVCGPTLSGLGTNFGLWPLLNKRLAIISDARLSGRSDQATITERLLSITGEDAITIDRKNLAQLTEKLRTRVILCSNELPRLSDASGALANRFLLLMLRESHLGKEDTGLTDRLLAERPGILRWAIEGWRRLYARGKFVQPATSEQAIEELQDLASPVGAFIRDWCSVGPGQCVPIKDLFEAWGLWCREQGRDHPGDIAGFGRNLRAAVAGIATTQPRADGARYRAFEGIDLTLAAQQTLSYERSARQSRDSLVRQPMGYRAGA